jgi:hypothetical protein
VSVVPDRTSVAPGQPLELQYRFVRMSGAPALAAGQWVFVHMLDEDGRLLWTDDHQPPVAADAWGADPVEYRRTMFVPRIPLAGDVRIAVGLVNPASAQRAPLAGRDRGDRSYDVAAVTIVPADSGESPAYGEGWYDPERDEGEPGRPWRWSAGSGRLTFRNPRRDARLVLEVDQPIAGTALQRIEARIGADVVGAFALRPGSGRVIERITVPAARLGTADAVEITIGVDPTFVPASTAGLSSSDDRTLGVRLFNAHLSAR